MTKMNPNQRGQMTGAAKPATDGQATEVGLVGAKKWVPILRPKLIPNPNPSDRKAHLTCPGCGTELVISQTRKVLEWLRTTGLPICGCGHRYTTNYEDESVPVYVDVSKYDKPTKATRAVDPKIEQYNRIRLLREKLNALHDVADPSGPEIKKAEAELKAYLESIK